MKKLFSILLSVILVFSFAACGDKEKDNKNTIDLEYYAKLGQIPEMEYTLGTDVDTVTDQLNAKMEQHQEEHEDDSDHSHDHNEQEFMFQVLEGENNVLLDNGTKNYYYNKKNKEDGISYIVNYDTAFGLEIGTVSVQVKESLSDYELKEENISEENAFFATYISEGTVLKAEIDEVVILFVFQENELFATAMYDVNNWSF